MGTQFSSGCTPSRRAKIMPTTPNSVARQMPGITVHRKQASTDSPETHAYIIIRELGGISRPSGAEEEIKAAERPSL